MRLALALLTVVVLGLVAWLVFQEASPPAEVAPGVGATAAPQDTSGPALVAPEDGSAAPGEVEVQSGSARAAVDAPTAEAADAGASQDGVLVRVLRAEDRAPIEGALVHAHSGQLFLPEDVMSFFAGETDLEALLLRDSVPRLTDAEGYARVPVHADGGLLRAAAGTRSTLTELLPGVEEPVVVLLGPPRALTVLVRRHGGQPAADFPLDLRLEGMSLFRVFTDAEGRAELATALELSAGMFAEHGSQLEVRAAVPLHEGPAVTIDTEALPTEPVVLELPPIGGVRVQLVGLDPDGPRATIQVDRAARGIEPGSALDPERHAPNPNPMSAVVALWDPAEPPVLPVSVDAQVVVQAWQHFEGGRALVAPRPPRVEGELVDVTLDVSPRRPVFVLTLAEAAEPAPRPLAESPVSVRVRTSSGLERELAQQRTSPTGRVELTVPRALAGGDLVVRTLGSRSPALVGTLALPPSSGGTSDLGTLVLSPAPLLVSGTVVEADGRPVERAQVRLERTAGEHTTPYAEPVRTDAEGRFALHGSASTGSYAAYAVRSSAGLHSERVPFEVGTRDLTIELPPVGDLTLDLRADEEVLAAIDERRALELGVEGSNTDWIAERVDALGPGAGRFRFRDVPTGQHELRLDLDDETRARLLRERVTVQADEDTRLETLDLRGAVHAHALRTTSPDGTPTTSTCTVRAAGTAAFPGRSQTCRAEGLALLTAAPRLDVFAWQGVGEEDSGALENVSGRIELVLAPARELAVRLPARLVAASADAGLSAVVLVGGRRLRAQFDEAGLARVQLPAIVALPDMDATLLLTRPAGSRRVPSELPESRRPLKFSPGQDRIELDYAIDDAQLDEWLQLLTRERR